MKSIISPFNDDAFNDYILKYIKSLLKKKSKKYECNYELDGKHYDSNDIIKSIMRKNNIIYFSNQHLINHIVYDLSQRFWYTVFRDVNNIIRKLYLEYRSKNEELNIQRKRKEAHNKYDR